MTDSAVLMVRNTVGDECPECGGKMFKAKLKPLIEMDIDMESEWTKKGSGMYAAAIDTTLVCKECGEEWLTVVDRVYMTEYIGGV